MKKGLVVTGAALLGGGILGSAAMVLYLFLSASRTTENVGIIGGADGPTTIFLMGRLGVPHIILLLPLVLSIIIGAALLITVLILKLKSKKSQGRK